MRWAPPACSDRSSRRGSSARRSRLPAQSAARGCPERCSEHAGAGNECCAPPIGRILSGSMTRVAILDDYQDVALRMADWKSLPPDTEVVVFRDHLDELDALAKRLADFD